MSLSEAVHFVPIFIFCRYKHTDHARVRAGLWDILGQEEAGSMAARPGGLDDSVHVDTIVRFTVDSLVLERSRAQDKKNGLAQGPRCLALIAVCVYSSRA